MGARTSSQSPLLELTTFDVKQYADRHHGRFVSRFVQWFPLVIGIAFLVLITRGIFNLFVAVSQHQAQNGVVEASAILFPALALIPTLLIYNFYMRTHGANSIAVGKDGFELVYPSGRTVCTKWGAMHSKIDIWDCRGSELLVSENGGLAPISLRMGLNPVNYISPEACDSVVRSATDEGASVQTSIEGSCRHIEIRHQKKQEGRY